MDARDVIKAPVVSEKSYGLIDRNAYTFHVHADANKIEIRQAVEEIFNVKVLNVTTMNRQGKRKRNRRTNTIGQRSATKRAIVKVAADDRIDIFGS
jgi:large subunit ribosomal protein L23